MCTRNSTRLAALRNVSNLVRMLDSEVSDLRERLLLMALQNLEGSLRESCGAPSFFFFFCVSFSSLPFFCRAPSPLFSC